MNTTLIVQNNTILVCIAGKWPKLFEFESTDNAREIAYELEYIKVLTVVCI